MKLRTTYGFMSGATMASSVPSIQIISVQYPLSSHKFLFYLPLHQSSLFTGFSNATRIPYRNLPPSECSRVQNNWHLLE